MKKLLAVLLALCVIGGAAFAQAKVAVGIDGKVTLIDQALNGKVGYYNNTYVNGVALSASDADGIKGLSVSLQGGAEFSKGVAPTIAYYKGYWNFFDKKVKLSIGDFSMNDYRTASLYNSSKNGTLGGAQLQQVMIQAYPVTGLSIGLELPYSTTETALGTIVQKAAIGGSYAIDKVGTFKAYMNVNTLKPVIGAGFDYTGTENLEVVAWVKADTATPGYTGNLSTSYKMDAITIYGEGEATYGTTLSAYGVNAEVDYAVNENITADVAAAYSKADGIDVNATVVYDFLNGIAVKPTVGFTKGALYWNVPLAFSVSF